VSHLIRRRLEFDIQSNYYLCSRWLQLVSILFILIGLHRRALHSIIVMVTPKDNEIHAYICVFVDLVIANKHISAYRKQKHVKVIKIHIQMHLLSWGVKIAVASSLIHYSNNAGNVVLLYLLLYWYPPACIVYYDSFWKCNILCDEAVCRFWLYIRCFQYWYDSFTVLSLHIHTLRYRVQ